MADAEALWDFWPPHHPTILTGLPLGDWAPAQKTRWVARMSAPDRVHGAGTGRRLTILNLSVGKQRANNSSDPKGRLGCTRGWRGGRVQNQ